MNIDCASLRMVSLGRARSLIIIVQEVLQLPAVRDKVLSLKHYYPVSAYVLDTGLTIVSKAQVAIMAQSSGNLFQSSGGIVPPRIPKIVTNFLRKEIFGFTAHPHLHSVPLNSEMISEFKGGNVYNRLL